MASRDLEAVWSELSGRENVFTGGHMSSFHRSRAPAEERWHERCTKMVLLQGEDRAGEVPSR